MFKIKAKAKIWILKIYSTILVNNIWLAVIKAA